MRVAFDTRLLDHEVWMSLSEHARCFYMHLVLLCGEQPEPPLIGLPDGVIAERLRMKREVVTALIDNLASPPYRSLARVESGVVVVRWENYKIAPLAERKRAPKIGPVPVTPQVTIALEELRKVQGYPFDYEKDSHFAYRLIEDFPTMNIVAEIGKWGAYKIDRPLNEHSSPRAQLRNWFEIALRRHVRDSADRIRKSTEHMQRPDEWDAKLKRAKDEYGLG